jgi:hypothetical protein
MAVVAVCAALALFLRHRVQTGNLAKA